MRAVILFEILVSACFVQGCYKRYTRSVRFRPDKEENLTLDPCRGLDFCENPSNYPHKQALSAVKNSKDLGLLSMMFTKDRPTFGQIDNRPRSASSTLGDSATTSYYGDKKALGVANGNSEFTLLNERLCLVNSTWIRPRVAKNHAGERKYIINNPSGQEEFSQFVHVTSCTRVNESCDPSGRRFHNSISTTCRQEYMEVKLLALDADMRSIEFDTFRFPSCCTCYILNTLEIE
eukprot:TRINITY_DN19736_c0_g2_i1.p1 TRINITY_DN19736_c0_g2~~TRINITY_DN19736_c0_g2_i1.p1  ORF type:complete len:234 (-),score=23.57 TRINITY_DN19736_c0_g2_i1:82-783(-)